MIESAIYKEKNLYRRIKGRQGHMETVRQPYDDRSSDIVDFCDPGLTSWENGQEGKFRGVRIYEGTPPWALRVMSDGWQGYLVSKNIEWLRYSIRELDGDDQTNKWLREREEYMYEVYRKSELYQALNPYTRFGLSVGSPVIIVWKEGGRHRCLVPHPKENYHGSMGAYHRKYEMTAIEAVKKFIGTNEMHRALNDESYDMDKLPLSKAVLNAYKNGEHYTKFEFIHAIYNRNDHLIEREDKDSRKQWFEYFIETNVDNEDNAKPIKEKGYFSKPHIRWDYERNTDEHYARTPAWNAIMDIRSGQELAKQRLEVGQRALDPAMWVMRKYRMNFSSLPGAINSYDRIDERDAIPTPIHDGVNYQIGVDVHQMTIQAVERWFQTDFFLILNRMGIQDSGKWPTATQIMEMQGEKALIASSKVESYTRAIKEIDDRFNDIEDRDGNMPEPPQIVKDYLAYRKLRFSESELDVAIEFLGPLNQLQKKFLGLRKLQTGMAVVREFLEVDPNLKHKVRMSKTLEKALEEVGFYQDGIVPEPEYEETLAAIAEAARQEQATETAIEMAKAVPGLSKGMDGASPMAKMLDQ